jgi:hypothetical protein
MTWEKLKIKNGHIDRLIVSTIGFVPLREKLTSYPKNNIEVILTEEIGNTKFDNEVFIIRGKRLIENNKNSG